MTDQETPNQIADDDRLQRECEKFGLADVSLTALLDYLYECGHVANTVWVATEHENEELREQRDQARKIAKRIADEQPSPEEIVRRHEAGLESATRALHDDDIREGAVDLSYPECADHYRGRVTIVLTAYSAEKASP
jgi:hypothetical protein